MALADMPTAMLLELPIFAPGTLGNQCAMSCKAGCCKYFSLPIETPRSDAEFDDVRWYLMHEDTHVYKYEGDWYLLMLRKCRNLLPNNLCAVYDNRPRICADYDPTDCEFTGEVDYELYFSNEKDLEAWLAVRKQRRRQAARKGARGTATTRPRRRSRG